MSGYKSRHSLCAIVIDHVKSSNSFDVNEDYEVIHMEEDYGEEDNQSMPE